MAQLCCYVVVYGTQLFSVPRVVVGVAPVFRAHLSRCYILRLLKTLPIAVCCCLCRFLVLIAFLIVA